MPLLVLLPSLFSLITEVVGPILEQHKTSIISQIVGGAFDGSTSSLMNIIENSLGKIEDQKRAVLEGNVNLLLAQAKIGEIAESKQKFSAHDFITWGLGSALLMSVLVEPSINYFIGFMGLPAPVPFVLSNTVIGLLCSLLGVMHVTNKLLN